MLSHQWLISYCPPLACVGQNSSQPGHQGLPKFWWEEHRSPSCGVSKWRGEPTCGVSPWRRGSAQCSVFFGFTWIFSPSPQFEGFPWRNRTKLAWPPRFTFKSSLSHKLVTLELGRQEFLMFFSFFLNLFLKFLLVYWGPCISKCEWEIIIGMGVKNN